MFPRRAGNIFTFNSDIVNYLLKTTRGRDGRPAFVIFVVWSVLIAGGCVVVVWRRKSCLGPAEITSFVCLVLFKDEGCRGSPRFHFLVSDADQGNEETE